ncbi:hypothetical protein TRP8649_04409 [Pelagimonas phthalicica]|uniref:Uncharacterized protein n=1 Tax=Pelagimonas phthalicica TaxID=1037362 RepID=A0A238JKE8_9RHOB|nr:hypothetical protein [Pelagimonas phthalicica]TDS90098.1 hypothetical protein CLV87_4155 [Pelagimonas phthalicica]SMX30266.1 hypothetical protein TRP8649_04409 [Pelagimonas phthalicica]
MSDKELARIKASSGRRVIGTGAMLALGALMLYLAFATPPQNPVWLGFLIVCGLFALWTSQMLWQATSRILILTDEALIDSEGDVLARIDQIAKVDRGAFAMKPSNGFVIFLKEPMPKAWHPGLWWRLGKRVAVGGVTSGAETKPVADIITMKITKPTEE